MTVRVFVSATSKDLSQDCRSAAIKAVHLSNAVPITMETWDTEYLDAVEVCRQKIEQESSHYLGIYAFRYGWIPPQLGKSITEAEFDWVLDCKKPMVVFLPNPTTEFATTLRCRASDQCPSDETAQQAFRDRVSSKGTYQPFDDVVDLGIKVTRRVMLWAQDGLRGIASQPKLSPSARSASKVRPSEAEIIQLDRQDQVQKFQDSLEVLDRSQLPGVVCFLIHGGTWCGHQEMILRLRQIVDQKSRVQPLHCKAGDAVWRQNNLAKLLELIGKKIKQDWKPESPEVLASQLHKQLETQDIILEITNIQRLDGSLESFIKDFWYPTVLALKTQKQRHRLVVLLTLEQDILPEWEEFLQNPPASDDSGINSMYPIKLPELKDFTEQKLSFWLKTWLSPEDAPKLAKILMNETKGRPQSLYNKLRDDSTWID